MDLYNVYVTQKNGCWIAIWRLWVRLGMVLLRSIGVGHVAGFPCREAASKLRAASTLPDKDIGFGHARFLGWATTDRTMELTLSLSLPLPMVALRFPLPRSPRVDDVVSATFTGDRLLLPCPFLSAYRFLQLSLFSRPVPLSP
jgi:hypothetical protein